MAVRKVGDLGSYPKGYEPDDQGFRFYSDKASDRVVGSDGNDHLFGNGGNDRLSGGLGDDHLVGGTGRDILTGGLGSDAFIFDAALGASNVDRITDFSRAQNDKIMLDDAIFTKLARVFDVEQYLMDDVPSGVSGLVEQNFRAGKAAQDQDDRIIYDRATGKLFYDADGNGAQAAVQFAALKPGTSLTWTDIVIG